MHSRALGEFENTELSDLQPPGAGAIEDEGVGTP